MAGTNGYRTKPEPKKEGRGYPRFNVSLR